MGLTSALNTALNGLALNETTIDVLGNNIANAGTYGFKASSVRFETQLARTLSIGSRPDSANGGTNPRQTGLGANTAAISRDFGQGNITNSSSPSDLAIQGDGFFITQGSGGRLFTRNGNFSLNSDSKLVNDQGQFVQGYTVDPDFNLIKTELSNISIPLGRLQVAQQTSQISLNGALFPTGQLGTQGTVELTEALTDSTLTAPNNAATGTTLLSDTRNAAGQTLFSNGDVLSFTPKKGGRTLKDVGFTVTATSTVNDLMQFYSDTLGLQSGGTIANDAGAGVQPGVTITAGGQIRIVGNAGQINQLSIISGDLKSNGAVVPITFTRTQDAVGEGASTDFVVYDSLGQTVNVRMTSVLESRGTNSTTYRYYVESFDDSRRGIGIANGTITFDSVGKLTGNPTAAFSLQRANTAAVSPQQITIDFSGISGISSQTAGSTLNLAGQNGSAPGTLQSFIIDERGVINGVFDNGIIRSLGQVVLGRFSNTQGLLEGGGTAFREGVASGTPSLVTPGNFGAGTIRAGAIELSNTDIGRNLVDLITASTNYRGNARVISSVNNLVDELIALGRQ